MTKNEHRQKKIIKQKRTSQISVRMTPMERKLIESRAKKSGYSMSAFLVESALGKEMKILSDEEKKAYTDLANYHTNFNRISSLIRQGTPLYDELKSVIDAVKTALKKISDG